MVSWNLITGELTWFLEQTPSGAQHLTMADVYISPEGSSLEIRWNVPLGMLPGPSASSGNPLEMRFLDFSLVLPSQILVAEARRLLCWI